MNTGVVEQIKGKLDIVAVISEHVNLTRKGKSFWGLCPFHAEKDASFTVNAEKQVYKCFGCGEGGDVFSFAMKVKGLSFAEVLEEFAQRTGVVLERDRTQANRQERLSANKAFFSAGKAALEFFTRTLASDEGRHARTYLKDRGLSDATIHDFAIGYAPEGWDGLVNYLKKRGVPSEIAAGCGLVIKKEKGGYYDRFRGRVMFPILDLRGEVVAFGGRIIGPGEPKYINSPESPVFEKRKLLYNLNQAKRVIQEQGAVVVEGYMDVVSLANAGFAGAVATLGTALSEDHIRLLKRFTTDITLVFDGDAAGRKAMVRALEPFLATGIIPKVVILPQDKDPDDMARTDINLWKTFVSEARSIWDFMYDESFRGRDPSKFEHQSTILKDLAPMIARENDATVRDLLVERLAVRLGLGIDTVARQVRSKNEQVVLSQGQTKDYTEADLVRLMLFDEQAIQAVKTLNLNLEFKQADTATLAAYLIEHGNCILNDAVCPDAIRSAAAKIIAQGPYEGDGAKALRDNISKLLSLRYDRDMNRLQGLIAEADKTNDKTRLRGLQNEKMALVRAKRNIHTIVAEALEGK